MENFEGLGLNSALAESLKRMNYNKPTPIQALAIPLALKGRDVMGTAQTGTGKTAAYAIPLVEALLRSPTGSALVLTPTRELGKQVMDVIHQMLGHNSPIKTAFLIGGESMGRQNEQLRRNPRLIVGTPGRINDHLERRSLRLSDTGFLVLDETDRMLDMGFSVQLDRILKYLPAKRQTLMFSATLPHNIVNLSRKYLNNPERIAVGSTINPVKNIKQEIIRVDDAGKYAELIKQLDTRAGSIIVFVKTKYGTERLAKRLNKEDFDAEAIHGDLRQNQRNRVIQEFRDKKYRILVATDVAARGLDIPHIEHVINYDLPQVPEDYIHRIGRTARAGAEGSALALISPADGEKWRAIEQLMNPGSRPQRPPQNNSHQPKKPHEYNRKKAGKRRFHNHHGARAAA
jgi:ATP-dependent RNA helicase DeaD